MTARDLLSLLGPEIGRNCARCGHRMEPRDIDDGPTVLVCPRCHFARSASSNDFSRWTE